MKYIAIIITYVLVNNFILTQFMGLCPFIGVSRNVENAIGMGFALTFTTTLASIVTWAVQHFILVPLHIEFLQTISFILVIAGLVQFIEIVIQRGFLPRCTRPLAYTFPSLRQTALCSVSQS